MILNDVTIIFTKLTKSFVDFFFFFQEKETKKEMEEKPTNLETP